MFTEVSRSSSGYRRIEAEARIQQALAIAKLATAIRQKLATAVLAVSNSIRRSRSAVGVES